MSTIIAAEYKGKAENIWNDVEDAEELRKRLRQLPGYGEEKTEIFKMVAKSSSEKPLAPKRVNKKSLSGFFVLSHLGGSNSGPARYECAALPTELRWPKVALF